MSIPCSHCGLPAEGLMTVRLFGENSKLPYICVSDAFACSVCSEKNVWTEVVTKAILHLSKALDKVVWTGARTELERTRAKVEAKGLVLKYCPVVEVGLTLLTDPRADKVLRSIAAGDKKRYLLEGGRLQ